MSIEIVAIADHEWAVQVQENEAGEVSYHKVKVSPEALEDLGISDERRLVRESVAICLEHGPSTRIPKDLTVDWLVHNVPGFGDDHAAHHA